MGPSSLLRSEQAKLCSFTFCVGVRLENALKAGKRNVDIAGRMEPVGIQHSLSIMLEYLHELWMFLFLVKSEMPGNGQRL